jgi:hypothetical protein
VEALKAIPLSLDREREASENGSFKTNNPDAELLTVGGPGVPILSATAASVTSQVMG